MSGAREGLTFGVEPLDNLVPPAPWGSTTLLINEPGVEAEPFLNQAAHTHLAAGRDVVYVVVTRSPSSVITEMNELGFNADEHTGELHFVDAFSALLGTSEDATYAIHDPSDVAEVAKVLARAARQNPDAVCLFDSLSGLIDQASPESVAQAFPELYEALEGFGLSAVLFTHWPYAAGMEDFFDRFDAVLRFGAVEDRVLFGEYFEFERVPWAPGELGDLRHLYKTKRPGGLFVYIPKIVVTGPYNSGKSTFIQTVSDAAVSVDRLGTTVALDHGHVTIGGVTADIFGTPGQVRFDPILRTVAGQALGVIVLLDASKPSSFERGRELLEKTWETGLPALVVANKQDLPNALSPEEVAKELGTLDREIDVIGATGNDPKQARQVLEHMSRRILEGRVKP